MGRTLKIALTTIAGAVIGTLAAIGVGRRRFDRRVAGEVDDLFAARATAPAGIVTEADLAALPAPVQRWLRFSGVVGASQPSAVRLKQLGEIRLGERRWFSFSAEEYYTTNPPGFVWRAKVKMVPLVSVVGRDAFVGGRGSMKMLLLGVIPVAQDSGPEMDEGDLLRYLNEIMWFPAGALSPYIAWEAIDETSARATMTYGGVSAPAVFFFDAHGLLTNMTADRYDREAGARLPWSTPITAYGSFGGQQLPLAGEAISTRASGDYPYIRIRVTTIELDRPTRFDAR